MLISAQRRTVTCSPGSDGLPGIDGTVLGMWLAWSTTGRCHPYSRQTSGPQILAPPEVEHQSKGQCSRRGGSHILIRAKHGFGNGARVPGAESNLRGLMAVTRMRNQFSLMPIPTINSARIEPCLASAQIYLVRLIRKLAKAYQGHNDRLRNIEIDGGARVERTAEFRHPLFGGSESWVPRPFCRLRSTARAVRKARTRLFRSRRKKLRLQPSRALRPAPRLPTSMPA